MLKGFKFLQSLTDLVMSQATSPTAANTVAVDTPETDFWDYAEPAGEEPDPIKRNVLQWRRSISAMREPLEVIPGQPVNLLGFVHRTSQDSANQFTLARQVIRCCLADTVPLGLTVFTTDAERYETDCWLKIQGIFTVMPSGEGKLLAIAPDRIERIDPPQKLYINGVF